MTDAPKPPKPQQQGPMFRPSLIKAQRQAPKLLQPLTRPR